MKLHEAIEKCLDSEEELTMRRESWTHDDLLVISDQASYMGGSLYWGKSRTVMEIHYIDDLLADDWIVE